MRSKSLLFSSAVALLMAAAQPVLAIGEDEFLAPEKAFTYTATATEREVTVEWQATKGYYLYKKRMGLATTTPGATIGEPAYPKAEIHKDDYFGEQEVFRGNFKVTAPLSGAKAGDTLALKLKWQGCADAGLCYPPSTWDATVKVSGATTTADALFDRDDLGLQHDDEYLDPFFGAVVDATEAAVIDSLFRADTVEGRDGHVVPGLPIERTLELLAAAGRLAS